jgi:predicted lactoylglutathione lyase
VEQRISLITLGVDDLDRSRTFYERLGWTASGYSVAGVVAFFQCGGLVLALWGRAELAADAGVADDSRGFDGISLALNVATRDEVDSVLREAEAAGARMLDAARDTDWSGYIGHFADPDGHIWEIAWNPHFTIGPDGSVTLPG